MRTAKRGFLFFLLGSLLPGAVNVLTGAFTPYNLVLPVAALVGYTLCCIPHEKRWRVCLRQGSVVRYLTTMENWKDSPSEKGVVFSPHDDEKVWLFKDWLQAEHTVAILARDLLEYGVHPEQIIAEEVLKR